MLLALLSSGEHPIIAMVLVDSKIDFTVSLSQLTLGI
jgi:hypothetical protein